MQSFHGVWSIHFCLLKQKFLFKIDKSENINCDTFSVVPSVIYDNGTVRFKNINNCLNTNIYSYLETPGGQISNPYLNVVHFFNTSVN